MPPNTIYRRGSIVGALLLVGLGALFLCANIQGMNPWPLVSRWWPLLLILLGLGKLWDHFRQRSHPEAAGATWLSGGAIAVLVLLLLFGVALGRGVGTGPEQPFCWLLGPSCSCYWRATLRQPRGPRESGR